MDTVAWYVRMLNAAHKTRMKNATVVYQKKAADWLQQESADLLKKFNHD